MMRNDDSSLSLLTIIATGLLAAACSGETGDPGPYGEVDGPGGVGGGSAGPMAEPDVLAPGTVRGRVRDAVADSAVADATVCVATFAHCVIVEQDGTFELEAPAGARDVSVYVVGDGYYPSRSDADLTDGAAWVDLGMVSREAVTLESMGVYGAVLFRVIDVVGSTPTSMEGVVVRAGDYKVHYTNDDGRFDDTQGETGADGLALLRDVPNGEMSVAFEESFGAGCQVLADGGMVSETTLKLEAGTVTMVDVLCQ